MNQSWEYKNCSQTHNVEIGTEATQFPEKGHVNGIFIAVCDLFISWISSDLGRWCVGVIEKGRGQCESKSSLEVTKTIRRGLCLWVISWPNCGSGGGGCEWVFFGWQWICWFVTERLLFTGYILIMSLHGTATPLWKSLVGSLQQSFSCSNVWWRLLRLFSISEI